MEEISAPPWLEGLLSATFFSMCEAHTDIPKSECNMYCLDCRGEALCFYCVSSCHEDHQVIQIRRLSYHDVVRVSEIQKMMDISGVQSYVINNARVVFLNKRPHNHLNAKNAFSKNNSHWCEICKRNLLHPFRFCSLGCKLVGMKKDDSVRFVLSAKRDEETTRMLLEEKPTRLPAEEEQEEEEEEDDEELREGIHEQACQSTSPPHPRPSPQGRPNSRRRKGIPRRSPLM